MGGIETERDLSLDSTFFVAFDLTHRALKSGLAQASSLSVTQYRVLVKLLSAGPDGIDQSSLGKMLDLKPNVVTQAVNALAAAGYATRRRAGDGDRRVRTVGITDAGASHVAQANDALVERLYALFPTEDAAHRTILEASIAAGASIEAPPPGETAGRYAASRALVSLELVKRAMESALKASCGASLSECRVLQRLGEVGEPLRIGDLASQLQMTAVGVARAVDGLAERGWGSAWPAPATERPCSPPPRPRASGSGGSSRAPSTCSRASTCGAGSTTGSAARSPAPGASSSPTSKRARRPSAKPPSASSSPSTDAHAVCAWIADARLPHAKTFSAPEKRRARRSHFLFTAIGGKILAVKIFERRPLVYEPPFDPTDKITATALDIAEMVGRLAPDSALSSSPVLHRELRIKTIHSSLAIEQNTLTMEQVTDIIDGRRVFGPPDDIREVRNAKRAYDLLGNWDPRNMDDLLEAHGVMMEGLRKDAGTFRTKNAGVYDGDRLIHAGTPASYVPEVMADLFEWLGSTKLHPLLASCVFHYEFEFIHPFSDGNGRIGRLWHTLLLARWRSVLTWLPIESMIRERQDAYYAALNESNATGSSTAFVAFMLSAIRDAMEPFCTEERREDGLRNSILSLMAENPSITVSEIAEAVGLARRTTERAIASLKESGRVRRVGSPRAGHWDIP